MFIWNSKTGLVSLFFFPYDYRNPSKMSFLEKILSPIGQCSRAPMVGSFIKTHEFCSYIKTKHDFLPRAENILKEHQLNFSLWILLMKKFLLTRKILIFDFLSIIVQICNKTAHYEPKQHRKKNKSQNSKIQPLFFFDCFEKKKK